MSRTITWSLSLLTALVALVGLGMHMNFMSMSYLLLTGVVLYHGFYGLHCMLTEFWTSPRAEMVITVTCSLTGSALFLLALITRMVV